MATTVRTIVEDALGELNVLALGETASAGDGQAGLRALNSLIDQWAAEKLQIYGIVRTTWTIVASTQTYTVGTGGTVNIVRPQYIEHVNFQDTSPTLTQEYQLSHLTEDAWSRVPVKTLTSPFPTSWFYDSVYPLGNLSFWPIPTSTTLQGVIYAATAVPEFAGLTTAVALPPGYRRMFVKNLAVDMASAYGRQVTPIMMKEAEDTVSVVKRNNKRTMDLSIDAGALIQGRDGKFIYDVNTGP